jgi:hypothetical protein
MPVNKQSKLKQHNKTCGFQGSNYECNLAESYQHFGVTSIPTVEVANNESSRFLYNAGNFLPD